MYGESVGKYVSPSGLCIYHGSCLSSWGNSNLSISWFQKECVFDSLDIRHVCQTCPMDLTNKHVCKCCEKM